MTGPESVAPIIGKTFDPWEAIGGVLTSPVQTLAAVVAAKPVGMAAGLVFAISAFATFLGLQAGVEDLPVPGFQGGAATLALSILVGMVVLALWFMQAGIGVLLAELLGGVGTSLGLLAALGFAHLPSLVAALVDFLMGMAGLGQGLRGLVAFAALVWVLVLQVHAVRLSYSLSTGKAVAVLVIPLVVAVMLAIAVVIAAGLAVTPLLPQWH